MFILSFINSLFEFCLKSFSNQTAKRKLDHSISFVLFLLVTHTLTNSTISNRTIYRKCVFPQNFFYVTLFWNLSLFFFLEFGNFNVCVYVWKRQPYEMCTCDCIVHLMRCVVSQTFNHHLSNHLELFILFGNRLRITLNVCLARRKEKTRQENVTSRSLSNLHRMYYIALNIHLFLYVNRL